MSENAPTLVAAVSNRMPQQRISIRRMNMAAGLAGRADGRHAPFAVALIATLNPNLEATS